jgi:2-iminobutanoate/2-iminopropanoate deaminase
MIVAGKSDLVECSACQKGNINREISTGLYQIRLAGPESTEDDFQRIIMATQQQRRGVEIVPVEKRAITNHTALNEAYEYAKPSSFSRGMRVDLNGLVVLLISGTASVDEHGDSVHVGDFREQCRRTFQNIAALLAAEGATWKDVVRTSCYLRDIDRDYAQFNEERTAFYKEQGLNPLPASTGIQAKLCRPELLVEVEAIAMFRELPRELSKE